LSIVDLDVAASEGPVLGLASVMQMRTMIFTRFVGIPLLVFVMTFAAGCSIPVVNPGSMELVQPVSKAPRAGNVYLVRGWLGVFSTGIDTLGDKVKAAGVADAVYQEAQWRTLAAAIIEKYKGVKDPEPLILVGHSYGADDIVAIARELEKANLPVDLLVTIDATTPPSVPANVRRVYNLYQTGVFDALPFIRGIPLQADPDFKGKLENVNIRVDRTDLLDGDVNHFNIEKKDKIHQEALKQILATCPPRAQWTSTHRTSVPIMAAYRQGPSPRAEAPTTRPTASASSNGKYVSNNP
jgi:pimeloyl-ACP methyl ester carboxylesterase